MTAPQPEARSPAVSALVVGCLALQLLAASRLLCPPRSVESPLLPRVACRAQLWPFLDYPMYSGAHRAGEVVTNDTAVALLEGGGELRFQPGPGEAGLAADAVVDALRAGGDELARRLAGARVPAGSPRIVELRLERVTYVLERSGFVAGAPELVRRASYAARPDS